MPVDERRCCPDGDDTLDPANAYPEVGLHIVRYSAKEVARQRDGALQVLTMLEAWCWALQRRCEKPDRRGNNSRSTHGTSIDQAKAALRLALGRLRRTDTFNVIRFNHTTDALSRHAQVVTALNLNAADRYVGGLPAGCGR